MMTNSSSNEFKKGWEFADFAECLTYHENNATFSGKIQSRFFFKIRLKVLRIHETHDEGKEKYFWRHCFKKS